MLNPLTLFKPQKLAGKCLEDLDMILTAINPEAVQEISEFSFERLSDPQVLKYLLTDRSFVIEFLTQIRILINTLQVPVKQTQKEAFILSETELKTILRLETQVTKMLQVIGPAAAELVTRTLSHEDHWANWKDQRCKGFDRPPVTAILVANGNSVPEVSGREPGEVESIPTASKHLTFLSTAPQLDDYIAQVEQDEDPDEEVEEKFKKKNDPVFTWRMLRLVSEKSVKSFQKVYNGNIVDIAREMKTISGKRPREEEPGDEGYKRNKDG